jgi:GAF domain-containing protein
MSSTSISTSVDGPDPVGSPLDEAAAYHALSQIAWDDLPVEQILEQVADLAWRVLPGTPQASVTLLGKDGRPHTAAFSGTVALKLDEQQYDDGYGPCLDAAMSGGIVRVAMADRDGPYPNFRQSARRDGITHSMSLSIPTAGHLRGGLNLYTSTGQSFTPDSARIAGTIAAFAGFALTAVERDEDGRGSVAGQLRQAVTSRALVSHAQHILMAQLHCSREQAFSQLRETAERQGVTCLAAAQALVDRST